MWAGVEYYSKEYLLGRQPSIPLKEFLYWEKRARSEIGRDHVGLEEVPGYLKDCVCEVAEYLHMRKVSNLDSVESFSNDGFSVKQTNENHVRAIIQRHLSGTELHNAFIFSGV